MDLLNCLVFVIITVLSYPKFRPTLLWGTQQMITPPTRAALNAQCSNRLNELAKPKKNFQLGTIMVNFLDIHTCVECKFN